MKTRPLLALIVVPILLSCLPKKPEIPLIEAPAGPVLHALEQRRRSFESLKALASVDVVRKGNKRGFENVGIVLDGLRRLRLEAFGPLGQSELALVWDGTDAALRMPGSDRITRDGQEQLERLLGGDLDVRELGALLSGNIAGQAFGPDARLFCTPYDDCVIAAASQDGLERRVRVRFQRPRLEQTLRVVSQEISRSGELVYRAEYDRTEEISSYPLPMRIEISGPDRRFSLIVLYNDVEVNVPVSDGMFTLPEAGEGQDR